MNIISAERTEYGAITVTTSDGPMSVPDDMQNRHRRMLHELGIEIKPYSAPQPEPPSSVTPAQLKIALYEAGLLEDVESLVSAHPYRPVSIWWAGALSFERGHAYLNAIGLELGLTDEDIDLLFLSASAR